MAGSRQLSSAGTGTLAHTLPRGAATPSGPHMLQHGLDVLEQNVAAAIEPNALTGGVGRHMPMGLPLWGVACAA